MHIISIEEIKREAIAAAKKTSNFNDFCPYHLGTDAGEVFQREFEKERCWLDNAINTGAALDIVQSLMDQPATSAGTGYATVCVPAFAKP